MTVARRRGVVPTAKRGRTTRIWILVAAAALVINGVTVTTLLAGGADGSSPVGVAGVYDDERAASAVDLAETQVLGVVSLDSSSGNAEITELADRTTAAFRTDFDEFVTNFLREVRADGMEVQSQIVAAGISAFIPGRATVIVATSGETFNNQDEVPRSRDFQVQVVLAWIGGDWRVDGLEFV